MRFFTLVFATVGGWLGWKLGMYVGILTAYFASVIGTAADPQGLAGQIARLERAGVWVLPSNAQAARAAACIAGPEDVMKALTR